KKSNMAPFYYETVTADLAPLQALLGRDRLEIARYVRPEAVRKLIDGRPPTGVEGWGEWLSQVWCLATTECWLRYQSDPDEIRNLRDSAVFTAPASRVHDEFRQGGPTFFRLAGPTGAP